VSWKDEALENIAIAESQMERALTAEKRTAELEAERAKLWNKSRELRGSIDVEKSVAESFKIENRTLRNALENIGALNEVTATTMSDPAVRGWAYSAMREASDALEATKGSADV
jgi:hypothetical protein